MGDHDELPLPRRSADTQLRRAGERETHVGAGPMARQPSPLNVGDKFGEFTLEKFLGEGSSGYVFRALESATRRHYALKLVCSEPAESLVRTKLGFRRMMRIEHPNLARADRIHRLGNLIALSMEEIRGDTLAKSIIHFRKRPRDEACSHLLTLMREYASALAAMHGRGFVHRDIKPQNLMIDEQGHGKIIDYGLVGTFDAETDPSGLRNYLVGTPGFFAPEALSKQCYLPAGDIYGLGCVILKSLRVISAETPALPIEEDHANGDAINAVLDDIADSVPAVLHDACNEMLQAVPGDRPTARQIARHGLTTLVPVIWPDEKPLHGRTLEFENIYEWLKTILAGGKGRLHLHGPSGIGKTRLIDEVEKELQLKPYAQVFRARCRPREDHPYQAFDQIVDEIANRYMKHDLPRCKLDPVSSATLINIFPALKSVIDVNMTLPKAGPKPDRLDVHEAASNLSVELRKNGPLIVIIDDVQWADPGSLGVIEYLRDASGGSFGIVTISRTKEDETLRASDLSIELKGLSTEESLLMLAEAANRWSSDIELPDLKNLAELVEGNPFRLSEMAEEFRTGRLLSDSKGCEELTDSIAKGETLPWLCQRRVERLSSEAKRILPLIIAAGRPVSLDQINELSGLGEHADAPFSELVQQRLVTDEAIGNECISVVHDRISDGLIAVLPADEIKQAHRRWADWLLQQDQPHLVAARVAGHLFDADEPSRAISSAILAAKQSEKIHAYRDAGKWYARALPLVSGTERVQYLRDAARCFEEADMPMDAALHYQELAKFVDADERIECKVAAVRLLIRSGRFASVHYQLRDLTRELKLPRPKRKAFASLFILKQLALLKAQQWRQRWTMVRSARAKLPLRAKTTTIREQQRLTLCLSLARPLSLFDNQHASELNLFAARLSHLSDDIKSQLYIAIGSAVFSSYNKGPGRTRGETLLQDLHPRVVALDDDKLLGDYWAANAFTHMFACRWHLVCERAEKSVHFYNKTNRSNGFEISHTQSNCIWAKWHLGRWDELAELHDEMLTESNQRNDLIQRLEATSGLGATVWLARDEPQELIRSDEQNSDCFSKKVGVQLFDHLRWISSLQHAIYGSDWERASSLLKGYRSLRKRSPVKHLQPLRVMYLHAGALVSLHRLQVEPSSKWSRDAGKFIDALRGEKLDYTTVVAAMFDGIHHQLTTNIDAARELLQTSNTLAEKYRLRPIQCATSDALEKMDTGTNGESLQQRMRQQGIVKPDHFERLYTVRFTG